MHFVERVHNADNSERFNQAFGVPALSVYWELHLVLSCWDIRIVLPLERETNTTCLRDWSTSIDDVRVIDLPT